MLGAESLALLVPDVPAAHPLTKRALALLPELTGLSRSAVLDALLNGPLVSGTLPKATIDALVLDVADGGVATGRGRITNALYRYVDTPAPGPLADAAWDTRDPDLRRALLGRVQVTQARRKRWLAAADLSDLGPLLAPGTPPPVLEQVTGHILRAEGKGAEDAAEFTPERLESPGLVEKLLASYPVDLAALVPLLDAFPREPDYNSDEGNRRLRSGWSELVGWIARVQPHAAVAAAAGTLLPALDKDKDRSEEERSRWVHLIDLEMTLGGALDGVLDLLDDADLAQVVARSLVRAGEFDEQAKWWGALAATQQTAGADTSPESAAGEQAARGRTDTLFEAWFEMRQRQFERGRAARPQRNKPESAEKEAEQREHLRQYSRSRFDRLVDDPAGAGADNRRIVIATLEDLLPVLTGQPRPPQRPRVLGDPPPATARWGEWRASEETRTRLGETVRTAVLDLVLPVGPPEYSEQRWAQLLCAVLRDAENRNARRDQVMAARGRAQEWLRSSARADFGDYATQNAMNELVKMTAPAAPPSPRPEQVARELIEKLGANPSREQLDAALDVALVGRDVDLDSVLARGGRNNPERALHRLAQRMQSVLRAQPRPVSAQARSQACRAVLHSRFLTRDAVLDVPAFAVFGPEASGSFWGPRNTTLATIVHELIGDDPAPWRRLANEQVENKGQLAWRSTREVLTALGVTV